MIKYGHSDLCDLTFQCVRKHPFKDKKYQLYIYNNKLIIGEKYILEFAGRIIIEWKLNNKHNLEAFGFLCGNKIKHFYSQTADLHKLKNVLTNQVFFKNLHDFYIPLGTIDSGMTSTIQIVEEKYTSLQRVSKCLLKMSNQKKNNFACKYEDIYNEVKVLRSLKHKNIVKIHEVFEDDKQVSIILDYLSGGTLASKIISRTSQFTQEEIKTILKQILHALQYIHSKGIIHRDIKPENIMFADQKDLNTLQIIDFGLAFHINDHKRRFQCGTPGYMAPEVMKCDDDSTFQTTEKCDVFSVGCLLFELQQNNRLFPGEYGQQAFATNKKGNLNLEILKMYKNTSPALTDLVRRLLETNPYQRISIEEALKHQFFLSNNPTPDFQSNRFLSEQRLTTQPFTKMCFSVGRVRQTSSNYLLKELEQEDFEIPSQQDIIQTVVHSGFRVRLYQAAGQMV